MVAVKKLKPYHIIADRNYVRIILDYSYFSLIVKNEVYQFVPYKSKDILVNRSTKKIVNMDAEFTFKKGKAMIHIGMPELVLLPDFLIQLHTIAEPYYSDKIDKPSTPSKQKSTFVLNELEQLNIKRLIDKALDEHDEDAFYELVKLL